MTQLSIKVDGQLVRQGLQNLGDEIPKIGRLQIYRTAQAIQKRMKQSGAKPSGPIPWVSKKQRQAFYASDGFGGGIPHRRTDQYVDAWKIEPLGDTGYQVNNRSKGAPFIGGNAYGQRQSPIHQGRWPLFRDVADEETRKLPEEIAKEIRVVARRNNLMVK
jgi:hypothetical protein